MRDESHKAATNRRNARLVLLAIALCIFPLKVEAENSDIDIVLFGSLDTGSSTFANAGFKWAPERIDREGFAMLATVGAGARLEHGPAMQTGFVPTFVRATSLASLLGGYQFFFDWGVVGIFAGPEASFESVMGLAGFGPFETRIGARLQGEVWARLSENTLATVTVILGSARWDTFARVSAGYRIFGAYLGPEAAAYADRTGYSKWSLGMHATDFSFGDFSFRVSSGCSYESETRRVGPYVSVATWVSL